MTVTYKPAKREGIPLLLGVAGGTGSGKTYSALRLAKGIAGGRRFAFVDTENRRALHYADLFDFDHAELHAPFRPARYLEAIRAADAEGYPVIVVDSMSHEHAGEGGLLEWHEEILDRMAGKDYKARERLTFAAWVEPKSGPEGHKKLVTALTSLRAHVILCFRAEPKIEIVKNAQGKTEVRPARAPDKGLDGWIPVSEKMLPYELTSSFLLLAEQPGIPRPIKLQEQHKPFVPLDKPLDEEVGRKLAEWAGGSGSAVEPRPPAGELEVGDLTVAAFNRLVEEERIPGDLVRETGGRLFPGKSKSKMSAAERGQLARELLEIIGAQGVLS